MDTLLLDFTTDADASFDAAFELSHDELDMVSLQELTGQELSQYIKCIH